MMLRRLYISLIVILLAAMSATDVAAQSYNREHLRGNIRTINQGGLVPIDSTAILLERARAAAARDSIYYRHIDSVARGSHSLYDALPTTARDSIRTIVAAQVKRDSAIRSRGDSIAPDGRRIRLNKNGEVREPFFSDSMKMSRICLLSVPIPGFGQIYNKEYWKLGVLYPVVGTSTALFLHENKMYKPLKAEYDQYLVNNGYYRTPELDRIQTELIRHNTRRQIYAGVAIASYLYFIGDAALNFESSEVTKVNRATTLSTIFPGAGQVYNKSYWRVPIIIGGMASTIYTIDWNNRGYQRFKTAYALKVDYEKNPDKYPNGAADEFHGAYSSTFLKNLKNSYRRNRDMCILLTAGVYLLQILDAHVDSHLQDFDISDDLSMNLEPYFGYTTIGTQPAYGVNMSVNF
ncbi:MAG: hypothetical protein IKW47_05405 [Alistipes sp.]|nr:hypothetical protein [Alistipes sp.]